jgi:hypothetical protein
MRISVWTMDSYPASYFCGPRLKNLAHRPAIWLMVVHSPSRKMPDSASIEVMMTFFRILSSSSIFLPHLHCNSVWVFSSSVVFMTADFSRVGSLALRPPPCLEELGLQFIWPLPFDLPCMGGTARSLRYHQHSSPGHWAQWPPLHEEKFIYQHRSLLYSNHFRRTCSFVKLLLSNGRIYLPIKNLLPSSRCCSVVCFKVIAHPHSTIFCWHLLETVIGKSHAKKTNSNPYLKVGTSGGHSWMQ